MHPCSQKQPARSTSPRPPPATRSSATTYVASRDGDPYNSQPAAPSSAYTDRYAKQDAVGDVYSRGQANRNVDQDRSELFGGYKPPQGGSGRFFNNGPAGREPPPPGEETEEDVEGIKQQMRFTKQESVNSTRNALRLAREAEETARNTLGRLGDQSGMSFRLYLISALSDHVCFFTYREIGKYRTSFRCC